MRFVKTRACWSRRRKGNEEEEGHDERRRNEEEEKKEMKAQRFEELKTALLAKRTGSRGE